MNERIGSVQYLNARPLIYGIEDKVTVCEPAELADRLQRGECDVGLVPVAEVLLADRYDVIDGIAVASRAAVRSVFLIHRGPVAGVRRVALHTASRTSAWLVQVILKFGYGVTAEFYPLPAGEDLRQHEALLLIGDPAIEYAAAHPGEPRLDLGEAWWRLTGLPFVYAVWAARRGAASPELVALLQAAKTAGLAHLEEIVQNSSQATAEFRRDYLTRSVCFDLGAAEKQAIRRFQDYLQQLGLLETVHDLRYIN